MKTFKFYLLTISEKITGKKPNTRVITDPHHGERFANNPSLITLLSEKVILTRLKTNCNKEIKNIYSPTISKEYAKKSSK